MTERPSADDPAERPDQSTEPPVAVDRIRDVFDEYPVRLAILFGSRATGLADARSDVDVAVEFEAAVEEPGPTLLSLLTDLSVTLDRNDVDLALVADLDPRVGRAAFSHGILLCGSPDRAEILRERFETEAAETRSEKSLRDRLDATLERVDRHVGTEP